MSYTTDITQEGVTLIFGGIPIHAFVALTQGLSSKSVADPDVARMAKASFAFGLPGALSALKSRLADSCLLEVVQARPDLPSGGAEWLACGNRGVSSNTMFGILTGTDVLDGWPSCHPKDAADFWRCRKLLDAVPALAPLLSRMTPVSPQWAALVRSWGDICVAMDLELAPDWRTPPDGVLAAKTNDLIRCAVE